MYFFFHFTFYSFFTEGRCLLELTHRSNTEGNQNWIPTTKKVYWPPPGPVKAESSPSVQSGKTLKIFKNILFQLKEELKTGLRKRLGFEAI